MFYQNYNTCYVDRTERKTQNSQWLYQNTYVVHSNYKFVPNPCEDFTLR